MNKFYFAILSLFCLQTALPHQLIAQNTYFIDGYHGGILGHYPTGYTTFIADQMDKNPFWKLNLEIEPITWDVVKRNDASGYERIKKYAANQSDNGRIEFVNPSYGQSYLFNIQGESVIRQFEIGIKKIKEHFPEAKFTTYSSEEPCFTSALPQILRSFGYQYASLKNPNTCWGGYTTAYGGELVNWTGPDGSSLLTVPRYQSEGLKSNSTWQTIAWNNAPEYLSGARAQGIANPIGMAIQDAGWKNGPWLGQPKQFEYKLWKDYITNTADKTNAKTWNFTQENVQVSLVWGAQILQRLAQHTRIAENKVIMAEKLYAIHAINHKIPFHKDLFKTSWENLLIAQHHDSWIVPYNIVDKSKQLNWADQVKLWTDNANRTGDSVLQTIMPSPKQKATLSTHIVVYNTLGHHRSEVVSVPISLDKSVIFSVFDQNGKSVAAQQATDSSGRALLLFKADVPAMASATYHIKKTSGSLKPALGITVTKIDKTYILQTDRYKIIVDGKKGGTIKSLVAKMVNNKEFVDPSSKVLFNEMKGYFYSDSAFHSSADREAKITVVELGPLRVKLKIEGLISIHPFTQYLTLTQGEDRIDLDTKIHWKGNPGIGEDYFQHKGWKQEQLKKAFYNDRFKLSALFPIAVAKQEVYKNAAFDVLKSKLSDTFFSRWDSIKNNIIVNWVDIDDKDGQIGMALFTDHTTSYQHDEYGLLGLTLQYSGMGLWGRNYSISGPSEYHYALVPHPGNWDKANIWTKSLAFNEPLQVRLSEDSEQSSISTSLITLSNPNIEVSSVQLEDAAVLFRLFNPSAATVNANVAVNLSAKAVRLIELNGKIIRELAIKKAKEGKTNLVINIPAFGISNIKVDL
ncbi:alpha-mannosidase [Pedobacter sp. UYP24]